MESGTEMRQRLQTALGDSYAVERELGGGGMSQVFLARDRTLDRAVVIKVLHPEVTAAISEERFRREILLAAQLQHPHIVPVLAAGSAGGLDYYTMPLVEGESLRAKLIRGGALPVADAVRVLHDISDALAYAPARGIMHRDIKPENVLLNGQHALVSDFGVAKALTAGSEERGPDTDIGIAIGTPAYMAPEQAAADPDTDHRADLYAFGILAYELLSGRPPFAGRPAHEVLAAHLTEQPIPLREIDPDIPVSLELLVMDCLQKSPADRPQSAADVRDVLEALVTPGAVAGRAVTRRRRMRLPRRRAAVAAAGAGAVALVAIAAFSLRSAPAPIDEHLIAVAPFRVSGADPALAYLREGMLDLLAAKLTGEGGARAVDPRSLLGSWRREAGTVDVDLPTGEARAIAQRLGAGQLLQGDIVGTAERLVLNAALIDVRDGSRRALSPVEGSADSLPVLVDRLAVQLLTLEAGEQGQRLAALTSTSLPALRAYLAGQWLYRRARFADAAQQFQNALGHDSTFALAALGLASASSWYGDPEQQQRGMQLAWLSRDRLGERDRLLLSALVGPNYPAPSSQLEMLEAREQLTELSPDRPEAWFELGDGLFHFGPALGLPNAHDRAAAAFHRAISLDSAFAPALEHLVLLEAREGDTEMVRRLSALYLAVDASSENAEAIRWRSALTMGDTGGARDIAEDASSLTAVSAHTIEQVSQLDGVGLASAELIMDAHLARAASADERGLLNRMAHDLALNRGYVTSATELNEAFGDVRRYPAQELREQIRDALFWDGDADAGARAANMLTATVQRPAALDANATERSIRNASLCHLALWHAARGDRERSRRMLERLQAASSRTTTGLSEAQRAADDGCALMVSAQLAADAGSTQATTLRWRLDSLLRTAPGGLTGAMGNLIVARLHERAGEVSSALAAVRRREYFLGRTLFLSTYVREEARLAALAGDSEGAIRAYRHYIALRTNAEQPLQREMADARAALSALEQRSVGS